MSNKLIKVVLANDQVFPQTVAEAVLVNGDQVTTLDKVLPKKIEQIITPDNSGLLFLCKLSFLIFGQCFLRFLSPKSYEPKVSTLQIYS